MAYELLRLEGVRKSYPLSNGRLDILNGIDLTLSEGEVISVLGESGSGKSTLLFVAALLADKEAGSIFYGEKNTDTLTSNEITSLREKNMGFVFQDSLLLEDFSALENIALPLMISGKSRKEAFMRAEELIMEVGLEERKKHRPSELSGGEKQRIAIARSLSNDPKIIFADEPTGSLDEKNAAKIEEILLSTVRRNNKGIVLATHNAAFASKSDKVFILKGGKLERRG